jgi:hypothetical protein
VLRGLDCRRSPAQHVGGTNELRFSADGMQLYVAETGADHITRFRVGSDATLTDREIYGPDRVGGAPDGFAFDAHGNLWTTLIGQDKLVAITPEGEVLMLWEDGDRAVKEAARSSPQDNGAGTTLGREAGRRPGSADGQHHLRGSRPADRLHRLARRDLAANIPFTGAGSAAAALVSRLLTATSGVSRRPSPLLGTEQRALADRVGPEILQACT